MIWLVGAWSLWFHRNDSMNGKTNLFLSQIRGLIRLSMCLGVCCCFADCVDYVVLIALYGLAAMGFFTSCD